MNFHASSIIIIIIISKIFSCSHKICIKIEKQILKLIFSLFLTCLKWYPIQFQEPLVVCFMTFINAYEVHVLVLPDHSHSRTMCTM